MNKTKQMVLTLSVPEKTGILRVFGHRVSNIAAGQAGNISGQDVKITDNAITATDELEMYRTGQLHFTNSRFVGNAICVNKR